jgi:hypothetical protein
MNRTIGRRRARGSSEGDRTRSRDNDFSTVISSIREAVAHEGGFGPEADDVLTPREVGGRRRPRLLHPDDGPLLIKDKSLRSLEDLVAAGLLPAEAVAELRPIADRFVVGVSPQMAAIIQAGHLDGPVRRQFVPDPRELTVNEIERHDPIGDDAHSPLSGLVHRYPDRVLFKLLSVCPVYCRFCFRREMIGPDGTAPCPTTTSPQRSPMFERGRKSAR